MALDLTLLGTGSPVPSANRWGPSQAITSGDTNILVDCGWGATRRLFASWGNLRPNTIDALFLTHLHSDHISDIVDLLVMRWTGGATTPLPVYGPAGTQDVIDGARQVLRADVGFRLAHHGEKLWSGGTECDVHELSAGVDPTEAATIGGISVKVFEVDHRPVFPAFGFRFESERKSIVISGDTNPCPGLLNGARDADILVCDSMHLPMMEQMEARIREINPVTAELLKDAHDYHAHVGDVAKLAHEAGVKHLVLSHILPPIPDDGPMVEMFTAGLNGAFSGKITVGKDLMRISVE
jgi:ribonuclease Z